ncbi:MAG: serine/threonine protein kinase [Acidobacteriia bacterium]|nr:serine/threonine protein kinase [Terriglobia bacterium]
MAGSLLGRYRITGKLGAGDMGEVYQAEDTRLGRSVAIKLLPASLAGDEERMARLEREARVLASLNRPNIAAIYENGETEAARYLVLKLIPGRTLAEAASKNGLPPDEVIEICRQITTGLEVAHEKGVVHRDIKPANIMITPGGVVQILDFGLAKPSVLPQQGSNAPTLEQALTSTGAIVGTVSRRVPFAH